jgi:hypothetical protein
MTDANRRESPTDRGGFRYLPLTRRYRAIERTPRLSSVVRTWCDGCAAPFMASRVHARWCSDACRKRAARRAS